MGKLDCMAVQNCLDFGLHLGASSQGFVVLLSVGVHRPKGVSDAPEAFGDSRCFIYDACCLIHCSRF